MSIFSIFCKRNKRIIVLTTADIKEKAENVRQNNHPGHFTLSPLVELKCLCDFSDGQRQIKKGKIVRARQVCERGEWHDRVRLQGGNLWIPVEYFELVE